MFLMYKQYADKNPDKMGRGEGAVPTKGVGGYRPTTNWREISVRRRSVAARQVLACIIVSGVVIVAAGILLTVLGFLVIASQCPFMWREGAGSCYYLAPHNASWEEGRSYCTSQSAALLHLHSRTEADFITEVMSGRSWLGARRKRGRDNVWAWTDSGKALNYTRWTGSEPASLQQDLCAAVEPGGAWLAVACSDGDTAYVICDYVPGYNPSCWWDPWWRCAAWWCLCSAWRSASGGESSSPRTLRRSPTTRTTIDRWTRESLITATGTSRRRRRRRRSRAEAAAVAGSRRRRHNRRSNPRPASPSEPSPACRRREERRHPNPTHRTPSQEYRPSLSPRAAKGRRRRRRRSRRRRRRRVQVLKWR
ncbi:uncharacterized protein LOC123501191 isoform X3 [Portunus trituberculatus]|uniref:uncharacterized protein LOC123501191 isoform X3 n=1 Tax=Portunus trituberculatus TaxID=210409 RepID=UPI001E1CE4D8|nr:uncharacterized protein LOC123501191 isoform X3 [Portunus trituberculatus]